MLGEVVEIDEPILSLCPGIIVQSVLDSRVLL